MIPAGEFSEWLHATEASLRAGNTGIDVPCGECRGCCRSSMFISIMPAEKETIRRRPKPLLVPAPGLRNGHSVLGYRSDGECPMLAGGNCSIYEHRPQTCRDYDCRIFAATGIAVDGGAQPEIASRVKQWKFSYSARSSRARQAALRKAAAYLQKQRGLFPPGSPGSLPNQPGPLAALAVRVRTTFEGPAKPAAELVREILDTLRIY